MTEDRIANTAQQEYWNTVAGPRWVGFGGLVERCVRAVNDLLLARSAVIPGESVLEISCGTGAATVPFAEAVGERGRVVGVDISEPMLAGARQRIAANGLGNISLVQADAQVHRFEGARFDLIASRFGVMFFVDPALAFSNLLPAATCGATGRSPMFYLLGTARGEWPLADPPRDRLAPFGTSSAEPASSAGPVGLQ